MNEPDDEPVGRYVLLIVIFTPGVPENEKPIIKYLYKFVSFTIIGINPVLSVYTSVGEGETIESEVFVNK